MKKDKKIKGKPPRPLERQEVRQTTIKPKQSQLQLRRNNEFYQAIISNTTEGICVCHDVPEFPYVRFTVWNKRMAEITGYNLEEINLNGWYQTIYPDPEIQTRAKARMDRMREGENLNQEEWEITGKDGQRRLILISTRIVQGGEAGTNVLAVMTDITERKRAEETLKENEKRQLRYSTLLSELINQGEFFSGELRENLRNITEISARLLNTERVSIWTYNQDYSQIHCEDLFELSKDVHSEGEVLQSSEFSNYTSAHKAGKVIAAEDVFTDHRTSQIPSAYFNAYGIKSLLDAPVWIHKKLLALLSFEHVGEIRQWRTEEEQLALTLATYVSLCFEADERKQVEEELGKSKEKYRIIADNMADMIAITDMNLRFTYISPSVMRVLGFTFEEALEKTLEQVITPESLQKVRKVFEEEMKIEASGIGDPKRTRIMELEGFRKNGSTIRVEVSLSFLRDEDQKPIGILSITRDITERKRAEETLKLSEEKFSKAFKASPAWVVISSLEEGRYVEINDAFLKSTGFSHEEVIGRSALEINLWANPEERARLVSALKEKGSVRNMEVKLRKKSGEALDILLSAEIVEIAGERCMLSVSLDITDRKKAEQEIKRSEERYRTLVESSSDAIFLLDTKRDIVSCNQAAYRLFGYGQGEVEGKSIRLLHPSDESFSSFGEWAYPIVKREGSFRGEWNLVRKNGSVIPVEIVISAIKSPDGPIIGYVNMIRDISERKRMEQEKVILEEQFRQSQKMEAIGRLAGGIAHDFNNILTVIKGISQLSLLDLQEGDPLKKNIVEIEKSADRAADLTRQLLAFSRKQILEVQVLDMNGIIRSLDKMLHRIIGEDIELVTSFTEGLGRVKVDPGQIEQVIINLAVNARDAMPEGGKLTIETANVELDEEYTRQHTAVQPGRYVMLSVSDTGVGMTPEVKERIFEPFFTTKEMGKGTGLGLATAYGIVKQSGGNIWVYSEPGQGTTFKIYLPQVDEPLEELKEEMAIKEIPKGSETILVVEDEETVRELAVKLLKKQGYKVLEAQDGGKAFILCEKYKEPIHLILTDVVMPGMSGRKLVERLEEIHPEAKALYMSGYTDNVILHHGILEKGIEFIQKPFTLESLARKVREALDK